MDSFELNIKLFCLTSKCLRLKEYITCNEYRWV